MNSWEKVISLELVEIRFCPHGFVVAQCRKPPCPLRAHGTGRDPCGLDNSTEQYVMDANTLTLIPTVLVALGGIIMMVNILKHENIFNFSKELFNSKKNNINFLYNVHKLLMLFFLSGYIIVCISRIYDLNFTGDLFIGLIFLFGSIFVYIGIFLQSNMLNAIKSRQVKLIRKNEQLLQTQNVTIFALAYQAELRDQETGRHLERTSRYVKLLADELSKTEKYRMYMSPDYICDMVKATPLHDIGKVGVPDAILQKPGKLSPEEFEMIKQHCELGTKVLQEAESKLEFQSFFSVAIKLVKSHHEKWDGSGYPQRLKGEAIPLSARIMALADVYDALRSERCYKKALAHEETKNIILQGRGSHFDPDVVDAFLRVDQEFLFISETLKNEA